MSMLHRVQAGDRTFKEAAITNAACPLQEMRLLLVQPGLRE
jgi:hypothetical protein